MGEWTMGDNFIEKLLSDPEGQRLYFREDLIFEVTEAICKVMDEKGVSKAELAEIAGVSKSNITQLLSGDQNMRLTTIADLLFALGAKLEVTAVPVEVELNSILDSTASIAKDDWTFVGGFATGSSSYETIQEQEADELAKAA
jgi:transcriptional regulator with XRE-family HTH domain